MRARRRRKAGLPVSSFTHGARRGRVALGASTKAENARAALREELREEIAAVRNMGAYFDGEREGYERGRRATDSFWRARLARAEAALGAVKLQATEEYERGRRDGREEAFREVAGALERGRRRAA